MEAEIDVTEFAVRPVMCRPGSAHCLHLQGLETEDAEGRTTLISTVGGRARHVCCGCPEIVWTTPLNAPATSKP